MTVTSEFYSPFIDKEIAGYLRTQGITQAELASQLGMTENTFSWKRRGIREFKWSEVCTLADLIGFSLDRATNRLSIVPDERNHQGGQS